MKLVISSHCFLELLLIAVWVRRRKHVEKTMWRNKCVDNVCSLRYVVFGIDHPAVFTERLVILNWSVFPTQSQVQAVDNSADSAWCLHQTLISNEMQLSPATFRCQAPKNDDLFIQRGVVHEKGGGKIIIQTNVFLRERERQRLLIFKHWQQA